MNKINPNKFYIANEIEADQLFPWAKEYRGILNFLKDQVGKGNSTRYGIIHKPGENEFGNRYFVAGIGIKKMLEDFKSGKLFKDEN